jgi:hypothetical protein
LALRFITLRTSKRAIPQQVGIANEVPERISIAPVLGNQKERHMPGARKRKAPKPPNVLLKEQAAKILVSTMCNFLRRNGISERIIKGNREPHLQKRIRHYRRFMRAWEYVGVLLGTWYSNPKFLDKLGNPVALAPRSITRLIRASHVDLSVRDALQLMRCSPSIKTCSDGDLIPLRRVFVLPDSEVPRAAHIVERYLDTLYRNASLRKYNATLLERSCRATGIDISGSAPVLRDIKERGGVFMDAVDGEIEASRSRRPKRSRGASGELGVVVFAWARPNLLTQKSSSPKGHSKDRAPNRARASALKSQLKGRAGNRLGLRT